MNNDEWATSDFGVGRAPDAGRFVQNLAALFTGDGTGTFLAYSWTGTTVDNQVLIEYVADGGNVYLAGGTGIAWVPSPADRPAGFEGPADQGDWT